LLVEEPVVYVDELSPDEVDYLKGQRAHISQQLEEWCGLHLEVRLEGAAAIDPEGKLSDIRFPGPGMVPHAALILCEHLRDLHRQSGAEAVASWPRVAAWIATAMVRFADRWRTYAERPAGAEHMARDAVDLLARMRLVGWSMTASSLFLPSLATQPQPLLCWRPWHDRPHPRSTR
jgi:uncharacterized protein (TIGR02678 family)